MIHYSYILGLTKGCFYVGMTSNPLKRITQHFNGKGAKWTQLYKPINIINLEKHKSHEIARQKETEKYFFMKKICGKDKVRGAGHTKTF